MATKYCGKWCAGRPPGTFVVVLVSAVGELGLLAAGLSEPQAACDKIDSGAIMLVCVDVPQAVCG